MARAARRRGLVQHARRIHLAATLPTTVLMMFLGAEIDPAYRFGWRRRYALALRMYRNTRRIQTGTTYKAHLAMAIKLLETSPEVEGVVVECGCFRGGSTANLSLICEVVDRRLIAYDSFEGLPEPSEGDIYATEITAGAFRGRAGDGPRQRLAGSARSSAASSARAGSRTRCPRTASRSRSAFSTSTTRPACATASSTSGRS